MQLEEPCIELGQRMETPNQPIEIYRGGLKVEYKGVAVHGKGRIFVRWLPMPELWFEMQFCYKCGLTYPATISSGEAVDYLMKTGPNQSSNWLKITGIPEFAAKSNDHLFPSKAKFRSMLRSIRDPDIFAGNIYFPQSNRTCDYIKFYLTNFRRFRDLKLEETAWRLKLDEIDFTKHPDDESDILEGRMKKTGGFIITHACTLEQLDKSTFSLSDAINYLNAIYFFTSFLSGTWCGPALARGIMSEQTVWQGGIPDRLTMWTYQGGCIRGWMGDIEELFKNFMVEWRDREKQDAIKSLIQWYVEANLNAGGTEGSIILVHSALELCTNLNGYEEERPAYCMIRKLIKDLKVNSDITSKQANLRLVYDDNNYKLRRKGNLDIWDGPSIFSELRNAIVHTRSTKNYRPPLHQVPKEARDEALDLGLWYLELCILKMLGYKGQYLNRVNIEYEKVPWCS